MRSWREVERRDIIPRPQQNRPCLIQLFCRRATTCPPSHITILAAIDAPLSYYSTRHPLTCPSPHSIPHTLPPTFLPPLSPPLVLDQPVRFFSLWAHQHNMITWFHTSTAQIMSEEIPTHTHAPSPRSPACPRPLPCSRPPATHTVMLKPTTRMAWSMDVPQSLPDRMPPCSTS